jgi:hypothetical protein
MHLMAMFSSILSFMTYLSKSRSKWQSLSKTKKVLVTLVLTLQCFISQKKVFLQILNEHKNFILFHFLSCGM